MHSWFSVDNRPCCFHASTLFAVLTVNFHIDDRFAGLAAGNPSDILLAGLSIYRFHKTSKFIAAHLGAEDEKFGPLQGGKHMYSYEERLSNFDKARGIIGHECMNELIVDRLLTILGIPHLAYQLIHADVTVDGKTHEVYLCASEDFKAKRETKIALDAYKELELCRMNLRWNSALAWAGKTIFIRCLSWII